MKKIVVVAIVALFFIGTVAAYAAEGTSAPKKSGWQSVYDDISCWGKGSAKTKTTTTKTTTKTTVKRGTEPTVK